MPYAGSTMRTLCAPLLAAQKSSSAAPYLLTVSIADRIGGIRRLVFSRLYTGSESDGYHASPPLDVTADVLEAAADDRPRVRVSD
ncbi:MAG: hypothetical protein E6I38_09410 [Chloroflexi bacterium]|nr:MAG: hypothetical protein E6I38_09410 [Chloroflexota bacterium]